MLNGIGDGRPGEGLIGPLKVGEGRRTDAAVVIPVIERRGRSLGNDGERQFSPQRRVSEVPKAVAELFEDSIVVGHEGILVPLLLLERAQEAADLPEQPKKDEAQTLRSRPGVLVSASGELLILVEPDRRLRVVQKRPLRSQQQGLVGYAHVILPQPLSRSDRAFRKQ